MYISLHKSGKTIEQINDSYVATTIRNIYYNILKKNRNKVLLRQHDVGEYLEAEWWNSLSQSVELRGYEQELILNERKRVNEALNQLTRWERAILLHTSETSLRKLSQSTGITVDVLHRAKHKALKNLKKLL